ncbi:MAG: glycosyltransferase family 2 protein, partial [Candidatus Geothermincolia bacterium]
MLTWIWLAAGAAYWLAQAGAAVRASGSVPMLSDVRVDGQDDCPRVSVLICAKDEAPAIEQAIESRLSDRCPSLEFILVDDRSTDSTGEIMDTFAMRDERVRVAHVTELPDGWLGKLHALHTGLALATGDWLLLSDADVTVLDGTIARAVSYAEREGIDHVPLVPEFLPSSLLTDAALCVFLRFLGMSSHLMALRHRDRQPPVGSGAFNLIRRSAFDLTGGFEWLRMDIAEDFSLSQLLHETGARSCLLNGRGYVSLRFFESFAGVAAAAERGVFAATGDFKVIPIAAVAAGMLALEMSPFV